MARHFGPQHVRNGYAAMGQSAARPLYAGFRRKRTVAEAIAAARRAAAREAAAKKKKG